MGDQKMDEAEKTTIELQEAITDKLRAILGEEGVEILTEYVWHMLVNPKRNQHHLIQELQEFLADETENFVNWILAHIAPKVDSKVLMMSLTVPKDSDHKPLYQAPPPPPTLQQSDDGVRPNIQDLNSGQAPKIPERKYRLERRERILGLAVHQATNQDRPYRDMNASRRPTIINPVNERMNSTFEQDTMEDDQGYRKQSGPIWRFNSQQRTRGSRRYRSRSPDRGRILYTAPPQFQHYPMVPKEVLSDRGESTCRTFVKGPQKKRGQRGPLEHDSMDKFGPVQDHPSSGPTPHFPTFSDHTPLILLPPVSNTYKHPRQFQPVTHAMPAPPFVRMNYPIGASPDANMLPPPYMIPSIPKPLPLSVLKKEASAQGFVLKPAATGSLQTFPKKQKKRCSKWPDCPDGESCAFIHPTEMCNHWPHCPFGSACFYIHPQLPCKFGLNCHNVYCNYVHPSEWDPSVNMAKQSLYSVYFKNKSLSVNNQSQASSANSTNLSGKLSDTPPMMDDQQMMASDNCTTVELRSN